MPEAEIAYTGKAFLCRAMARLVEEEGLSLDVCSAGEIAVARAAGFPAQRLVLHGNVKTAEDLKAALAQGVGRIVIDSAEEITALADLAVRPQRVLIRVTPGVDGHTHPALTTGVEGSKFRVLADRRRAGRPGCHEVPTSVLLCCGRLELRGCWGFDPDAAPLDPSSALIRSDRSPDGFGSPSVGAAAPTQHRP